MLRFIISRLLQAIPVIFIVITATFFLVRAAPGGPFDAEKVVLPEVKRALEAQYKLDLPLYEQYFAYLTDLAQGELGPSFKYPGRSVNEILFSGLPVTAELGFYALLIALIIGVTAGVLASLKPNTRQDYIPMSLAMIGICMPSFLLGPLLVLVFGIYLEWLPISGWGSIPGDKILPSITLGAAYAAYVARLSRAGMLEILSQDYIRTARAKGLSERTVIMRHAFRNTMIPIATILVADFAGVIGGAFITESVFAWSGMGTLALQGIRGQDLNLLMGVFFITATLAVLANFVADLLYSALDPRIRVGSGA